MCWKIKMIYIVSHLFMVVKTMGVQIWSLKEFEYYCFQLF